MSKAFWRRCNGPTLLTSEQPLGLHSTPRNAQVPRHEPCRRRTRQLVAGGDRHPLEPGVTLAYQVRRFDWSPNDAVSSALADPGECRTGQGDNDMPVDLAALLNPSRLWSR